MLMGWPMFWRLAAEGEARVWMMLERTAREEDATMGMGGRATVASVDRECLVGFSPCLALLPRPSRSAKEGEA